MHNLFGERKQENYNLITLDTKSHSQKATSTGESQDSLADSGDQKYNLRKKPAMSAKFESI